MLSAFWRFLCSWDGWDKAMHRSSRKFRNNPYNHGCRVTDMGDRYLQLQVEQEGFTQSTLKQPRICHFFGLTMLWSIGGSCGLVNNYMPLDVLLSCPRLGDWSWPSMLLMLGLSHPNTAGISQVGKITVTHTRVGHIEWKWLLSTKRLQRLIHLVHTYIACKHPYTLYIYIYHYKYHWYIHYMHCIKNRQYLYISMYICPITTSLSKTCSYEGNSQSVMWVFPTYACAHNDWRLRSCVASWTFYPSFEASFCGAVMPGSRWLSTFKNKEVQIPGKCTCLEVTNIALIHAVLF